MSKQSERIRLEVEFQKKRVALLEKSGARSLQELVESPALALRYHRKISALRRLAARFYATETNDRLSEQER